jgi:Holliday junction resolvasome RuvABC endonuclease subunit
MARRRKNGIISLDTASQTTGWSYFVKDDLKAYGCIKTKYNDKMAAKLADFRSQLVEIFKKYNPSYVVIENGYYRINVTTLKVLCYFVGVARQTAQEILGIEAELVTTVSVRKFFGVKGKQGKELIFDKMKRYYNLKDFKYKTHNDMTDSIAQGLYFYLSQIREEEWPNGKLPDPKKLKKGKRKSPKTGKKRS